MLPRVLLNMRSTNRDARENETSTTKPQPGSFIPLFNSYGFVSRVSWESSCTGTPWWKHKLVLMLRTGHNTFLLEVPTYNLLLWAMAISLSLHSHSCWWIASDVLQKQRWLVGSKPLIIPRVSSLESKHFSWKCSLQFHHCSLWRKASTRRAFQKIFLN